MKAPNKIYIPFYPNDDGIDTHLGDDWFDSKDIDQYVEGWKEYIREGALIEWLEEGYDWVHNPLIAVSNLIDKLNSM